MGVERLCPPEVPALFLPETITWVPRTQEPPAPMPKVFCELLAQSVPAPHLRHGARTVPSQQWTDGGWTPARRMGEQPWTDIELGVLCPHSSALGTGWRRGVSGAGLYSMRLLLFPVAPLPPACQHLACHWGFRI